MTAMKEVAGLLAEQGLGDRIKLIVGGAPVTAEFADEIGADAYGYDALKAVDCVDRLTQEA
jgi:5-methyltetrahydrofolate--homocysteine methyltransferase